MLRKAPRDADTFVLYSSYYSGPLGDKFVIWKARRNGGIREPEVSADAISQQILELTP